METTNTNPNQTQTQNDHVVIPEIARKEIEQLHGQINMMAGTLNQQRQLIEKLNADYSLTLLNLFLSILKEKENFSSTFVNIITEELQLTITKLIATIHEREKQANQQAKNNPKE